MSTETDQTQSHAALKEAVFTYDGPIRTPEARKAFCAAFAKAQGGFLPIEKNRTVTITGESKSGSRVQYTFKYADLQEIHSKTRPALSANGLSTSALMIPHDTGCTLQLTLAHAEGFERISEVFIKYGEDIKQFGGKLSYMRRYMLQNLLDVAADDDLDENGQDTGGDIGGGQVGDFDRAPAPPPRQPARRAPAPKAAAPAQQPDDGIPPAAPIEGSKEKPKTTPADVAKVVNAGLGVVDAMQGGEPLAVVGENEEEFISEDERRGEVVAQTQAEEPQRDPARDGPATTEGERAYLLKRCRDRGGDMRLVLDSLGYDDIDKNTLEGVTKAMWQKIKDKT